MAGTTFIDLVETNVDGCGTDVHIPIFFDCQLSDNGIAELENLLVTTKAAHVAADELYDTDDLVFRCLKIFGRPYHYQDTCDRVVSF